MPETRAYRPRLATTVLVPALAVASLSAVAGELALLVVAAALVLGLGCLLLPRRAPLVGAGLVLGCLPLLVAAIVSFE